MKDAGIEDPNEYISFYGLRNHSTLNCEPITELIYVHSKLMIVDDKSVICGSANINDRSLIGKRDSEIAVLIEDEAFDDGVMNGKSFPCGKFAGSLRKYLFKEHLGLLGKEHEMIDFDITDPISDYFYKEIWYKTASLNTEFYEKVFHCIPTDKVKNFADLKKNQDEKPLYINEISRAEKMLESIQVRFFLFRLFPEKCFLRATIILQFLPTYKVSSLNLVVTIKRQAPEYVVIVSVSSLFVPNFIEMIQGLQSYTGTIKIIVKFWRPLAHKPCNLISCVLS